MEMPRPPEEVLAQVPAAVRAYLEALEAAVVSLQARVVEVEARLRQDSSTSSRPPSSDPPKTQARRRAPPPPARADGEPRRDRKSTRLNSSHVEISYGVF